MHPGRYRWLVGLVPPGMLLLSFIFAVRPWYMHWGATEQEVALPLPGDRFIPADAVVSTRVTTIQAPAGRV